MKLPTISLALSMTVAMAMMGCQKNDIDLPYNQLDGIDERIIVIPDSFQYISGDVHIFYHYDKSSVENWSQFTMVKLHLDGYGYIGRWVDPDSNFIVHPNVPANRNLTYGLSISCNGCNDSGQGKIDVSTF